MNKLKSFIEKWISGNKVRGFQVSLYDINECIYIYNSIINKEKPTFINGNVKKILDHCKIKTVENGIGWEVV